MANKKINQLVSKTSILSTDLFGIGDATTGQLFKKTIAELQAAIGGAVISVNGLVGTVVLDTDDIQELAIPTNKYFTDARARAAISLTVTGNSGASTYSSGTGVLNVPTYTLAGLGGITATFLSGGTGISYNSTTGVISYSGTVYTDSSIRALLSGGTGISYNSSTGAISYSGTVYTDSSIRALISLTTTGNSGASTYNNTTGVINVPEYTLAGLGGISLTSLSGGTGITYNNTTGAISYSGTVYTDSSIRALISATSPISYNSTTGVISITQSSTSVNGFLSSTDWNTFNNKQSTITLTTTGTSGNATFSSNTLNIPNYGSALSGYLPLTGGTLTGALGGTSASFSGNANADDYSMGVWKILDWTGGTAQIGGISASQWSQLEFFTSGTSKLTLASTGAATFSSSVTATGLIVNTSSQFTVGGTAVNSIYASGPSTFGLSNSDAIYLRRYGVGEYQFQTVASGASGGNLSLQSYGGNVGIGKTNPAYIIDAYSTSSSAARINIGGTTNFVTSQYTNSSTTMWVGIDDSTGSNFTGTPYGRFIYSAGAYPLIFTTNSVERMRITSAGAIGMNTSSPNSTTVLTLQESGTLSGAISFLNRNSTQRFSIAIDAAAVDDKYFSIIDNSAASVRLAITPGGNCLLGTTTDNGERLYVSGAIRATGTITANSDINLKKNLLKIENALEKVEQINGYTYEFKADDSKRHAGVIAQEIQTVLPEIVNKGNDGILGVEYGNISALLIEAIKEQNIKIKNLETLLASK